MTDSPRTRIFTNATVYENGLPPADPEMMRTIVNLAHSVYHLRNERAVDPPLELFEIEDQVRYGRNSDLQRIGNYYGSGLMHEHDGEWDTVTTAPYDGYALLAPLAPRPKTDVHSSSIFVSEIAITRRILAFSPANYPRIIGGLLLPIIEDCRKKHPEAAEIIIATDTPSSQGISVMDNFGLQHDKRASHFMGTIDDVLPRLNVHMGPDRFPAQ